MSDPEQIPLPLGEGGVRVLDEVENSDGIDTQVVF